MGTSKDYAPFVDFYCGKDRLEKHEVNRTVRRLWAGTAMPQQAVVLESASQKDANDHPCLIGVCGVAIGNLRGVPGVKGAPEGAYIVAFGIDVDYQKRLLDDGSRCGNALLQGALVEILGMLGASEVPYVFAKVKPKTRAASPFLTSTALTTWETTAAN